MPHDARTLRQVAQLHAACIDQGFLSSLGPRFLTVLYRAIDRSESTVLIVECNGPNVIAFVSGGAGMGPIYRQMLRDWLALTVALLPIVLNPRKVIGIVEILRRRENAERNANLPQHELFSIAVAPAARGTGTAGRLYRDLSAWFKDHNVSAFRIVVGDNLAPAHRFYSRMGAEPAGTLRVHGDSRSTVYLQNTEGDAAGLG